MFLVLLLVKGTEECAAAHQLRRPVACVLGAGEALSRIAPC